MNHISSTKVPVVIIGAGPTGLTAANLLGKAGIETLVIERNEDVCEFPRAIAIDDEGLRVCQATGLIDEILAHVRLNVRAQYISKSHFLAKVAPEELRNGYPLISTFHQPTFERILLKGLERFSCVRVYFQHTLETFLQDEYSAHISVRTPDGFQAHIECAYLLACDGGKSPIRRMLTIPMHSLTHADQKWLVVDGISESEPSDTILFFCNPARPAVSVPGPGTQRRWEFMLLPGEHEEDLLRDDTVHQLIKQTHRSYRSYPSISSLQIARQTIYTFHALIATKFSQGRVFLLGDAAHLMPPFGGQGMNSGLRDAHNLCWKLQGVLQGKSNVRLLESYSVERHSHVAQMILFSLLLGKVIMTTRRPIALLRDLFFRSIDKISPARAALTEMRIKPQPRYTRGFLLKKHARESKKLVGALLPQPYVLTQEGRRVLLDEVLGNSFTLIRLYENPQEAFMGMTHEIWTQLEVKFVCVKSHNLFSSPTRCNDQHICIVDIDRELSNFLHHKSDLYILVRPDRYIMGVFHARQAQQFEEDLQRLQTTPTQVVTRGRGVVR